MAKYLVTWNEAHRCKVDTDTHLEALKEAISERQNSYSRTKTCVGTSEILCQLASSPSGAALAVVGAAEEKEITNV